MEDRGPQEGVRGRAGIKKKKRFGEEGDLRVWWRGCRAIYRESEYTAMQGKPANEAISWDLGATGVYLKDSVLRF